MEEEEEDNSIKTGKGCPGLHLRGVGDLFPPR